MLTKITSKNGFIFLIKPNNLNDEIITGESVLLSIFEPDPFYFMTDIKIIKQNDISKIENPSISEQAFFDYMKLKKELKFSKKEINDYELSNYINYLPKINFKQLNENNKIIIKGSYKDVSFLQLNTDPIITIENKQIMLDQSNNFFYEVCNVDTTETLTFEFDLPKYKLKRSYKLNK